MTALGTRYVHDDGLPASSTMAAKTGRIGRIGTRLETAFCFLALSTFLGAYTSIPIRLQGAEITGGESNPFNAAALSLILVGIIVLVAINWRKFFAVARLGGPINLFVALAMASTLWSFFPVISLRRSLTLLQMVLFAYYLAARFPVEHILRLLTSVYATALVLSVILALAVPDFGVMQEAEVAGAWSGVFTHKSALGGACVLSTICFAWRWAHEPERRILYFAGILLCLVVAVMSKSKTAQLTIVFLGPLAIFLRLLRLPGLAKLWSVYVIVAVVALLGATLLIFFAEIAQAVGKDVTLTGRIPVWTSLLEFAFERPLGGHGFTAFFVKENADLEYVWRRGGWIMWDAHNSPIGIMLELGIPGLVLSQWVLLAVIWRSVRDLSMDRTPWAGFAAAYAISYGLISLVEVIMFRGDVHSVLLPMFYIALRQQAAGARAAKSRTAAFWPGPGGIPAHQIRLER